MDNILKVIYSASKNNKILSYSEIYFITEYLCNAFNLSDVINNIDITFILNERNKCNKGEFIYPDKCVRIYPSNHKINNNYPKDKIYLYLNLDILFTIIHELEHAKHYINKSNNSFNGNYLNDIYLANEYDNTNMNSMQYISMVYYTIKTNWNRLSSLKEYHTDINAYNIILKALEASKSYLEELTSYKALKASNIAKNYNLNGPKEYIPFLVYYETVFPKKLINFSFYSEDINEFTKKVNKEFSFEDKVLYGLPITSDEKNYVLERCNI